MKKALIVSVALTVVFVLVIVGLVCCYLVPYRPFEDLSEEDIYRVWTERESAVVSGVAFRLTIDQEEAFAAYLQDMELKRVPVKSLPRAMDGGYLPFLIEMENGKMLKVDIFTEWCVRIDNKYYVARKALPMYELDGLADDAKEERLQKILEWYGDGA